MHGTLHRRVGRGQCMGIAVPENVLNSTLWHVTAPHGCCAGRPSRQITSIPTICATSHMAPNQSVSAHNRRHCWLYRAVDVTSILWGGNRRRRPREYAPCAWGCGDEESTPRGRRWAGSTCNRGIFKKCVNSQAVYPLSEQHGLEAQERR